MRVSLSLKTFLTYTEVVYTLRISGVTIPPVHDFSALMVMLLLDIDCYALQTVIYILVEVYLNKP